jgi:hypothetical protein
MRRRWERERGGGGVVVIKMRMQIFTHHSGCREDEEVEGRGTKITGESLGIKKGEKRVWT